MHSDIIWSPKASGYVMEFVSGFVYTTQHPTFLALLGENILFIINHIYKGLFRRSEGKTYRQKFHRNTDIPFAENLLDE